MVSILVVAITCIKFEFTNDINFRLFAGECIYSATDRQTNMTHILHIHVRLPQVHPNDNAIATLVLSLGYGRALLIPNLSHCTTG